MQQRNILITGANRGLGFTLLSHLVSSGWNGTIFGACRSQSAFHSACERLKLSPGTKLEFLPLDLEKSETISGLAAELVQKGQFLDLVVNNAALLGEEKNLTARQIFRVNFYNTMFLNQELIKSRRIKSGGRIIFVSAILGNNAMFIDPMIGKCIKNASFDDLMLFSNSIVKEIDDQNHLAEIVHPDYMLPIYSLSKLFLNRFSELLGNHGDVKDQNISVYCCHPGWLATSEFNSHAPLKTEEGIKIILHLMEMPPSKETQGKLYGRDGQVKDIWNPNFDYKNNIV